MQISVLFSHSCARLQAPTHAHKRARGYTHKMNTCAPKPLLGFWMTADNNLTIVKDALSRLAGLHTGGGLPIGRQHEPPRQECQCWCLSCCLGGGGAWPQNIVVWVKRLVPRASVRLTVVDPFANAQGGGATMVTRSLPPMSVTGWSGRVSVRRPGQRWPLANSWKKYIDLQRTLDIAQSLANLRFKFRP